MKALAPVSVLLSLSLLWSCATGPHGRESEEQKRQALLLAEARADLEAASPARLLKAIEALQAPELAGSARARELSELGGELFAFLYPELVELSPWREQASLVGAPAQGGRYGKLFAAARRGEAGPLPEGALVQPDTLVQLDDKARLDAKVQPDDKARPDALVQKDFFARVLPALHLARRSTPLGEPESSRLRALLEPAAAENPSSVLPPYLLGLTAELAGDPAGASQRYRQAAAADGSFYPAFLRLSGLLPARGKAAESAAMIEEALKTIPETPELALRRAEAYLEGGQYEKAAAITAGWLLKEPERLELLLLRARILSLSGDWLQALKPLNLALRTSPESPAAYLLKAGILFRQARDGEAALSLLAEGGKRFPNEAAFPELSGEILLSLGRGSEGLEELSRALELEPGRIGALRLLLQESVRSKRWLQAAIYLSQILEKEQGVEDLTLAYRVFSSLGDNRQALEYAEKLYRLRASGSSLPLYARSLLESERKDEAPALIQKGLEEEKDPRVRSELLFLKAGLAPDRGEALRTLHAALLENPDNPEALLALADIYIRLQDYRRARLFLKRAVDLEPDRPGLKIQLRQVEESLQQAPEGSGPEGPGGQATQP